MHEKTKKIIEKILDTEQFIYTDDGTRTYRGIVYDLHAEKLAEKYDIHSWEELKHAPDDVVIRFYYDEYIVPSHAEDFLDVSINLAYQIADFAVNEGVRCAIKGIQIFFNSCYFRSIEYDESVNKNCYVEHKPLKIDGVCGPKTKQIIEYIVDDIFFDRQFENLKTTLGVKKQLTSTYQKIRESHYFSKLAKIRKKYGDKKCMDFLQSWCRRVDFRFEE